MDNKTNKGVLKMDYKVSKRIDELAKAISNFVNTMSPNAVGALGVAMAKDHRTLVQLKMRIVMSFLKELASSNERGNYDLRNEQACKIASKMLAHLTEIDAYMPFV